jgi:DNA-binding response OmpR family regulator
MAPARPRILSIGSDVAVFESRNRVLESAGFEVVPCFRGENALEAFCGEPVDVVVLCDSLAQGASSKIVQGFRAAKPAIPIVIVYRLGELSDEVFLADAAVESLDGPERLINTVASLLQKSPQSSGLPGTLKQRAG